MLTKVNVVNEVNALGQLFVYKKNCSAERTCLKRCTG